MPRIEAGATVFTDADRGFYEIDISANIERTRERLAADAPHALDIWDSIVHCDRVAVGTWEQGQLALRQLRARRDELSRQSAFFDNSVRGGERPTIEQTEKRAKRAQLREKLQAQIYEAAERKPPSTFSVAKLEQWAAKINGSAGFMARISKVPADPEKARRALELNHEARADFLRQRRAAEVAPLTAEEARVAAVRQINDSRVKASQTSAHFFVGRKKWTASGAKALFAGRKKSNRALSI